MKYDEIIKLLDAGYSREEILAMKEEPAPADPEPTPAPADPEPTPAPDPDPVSMDAVMKEVKGMFAEMKKELTAMNIMASRQPADQERSSEDILATIINPNINGGK
ncbi:MAG: hypothetical protein IIY21_00630 [Clostridiales bacterium]|nr:hypothetical protein [Clostridiales bacterium]